MYFEIMIDIFEIIGVIAFAASGAFKGIKKGFDVFGISVLAIITASGGGIIRDCMLNRIPRAIIYPRDLYIGITTSLIIYFFAKGFRNIKNRNIEESNKIIKLVLICDAFGLSLFTTIGANAGIETGLGILGVGIIATVTGVGGGIIRDLLANEVPYVLKEDIYATLSFIGGILYYLMINIFDINNYISILIIFILLTLTRLLAIKYKLNLPKMKEI